MTGLYNAEWRKPGTTRARISDLAKVAVLEIARDIAQARADLERQSAEELTSIRASVTGDRLRAARLGY